MCKDTQSSALLSAGSAMRVIESVMNRQSQSGIGVGVIFLLNYLIYLPTEHSCSHRSYALQVIMLSAIERLDFVFYNNTALAAKYAIEKHGAKKLD